MDVNKKGETMQDINAELRTLKNMLEGVKIAGDYTPETVKKSYTTPIEQTEKLLRCPDLKIEHLKNMAEQYSSLIGRFDSLGKFSPEKASTNEKIKAIEKIKYEHERLRGIIKILEAMEKDFDVTVIIGELEKEKQEYEGIVGDAKLVLERAYRQTVRDNSLEVALARRAYRRVTGIEEKYKDKENGILGEEERISRELAELVEIISRAKKSLRKEALGAVKSKIPTRKDGKATRVGKIIEAMLDGIDVTVTKDDLRRMLQLIKNIKYIPGFASDIVSSVISIVFMDKVEKVMLGNIKLRVSNYTQTNQEGVGNSVEIPELPLEEDIELEALKIILDSAKKSSLEFQEAFFGKPSDVEKDFGEYVDGTLDGHRSIQRKIDMLKLGSEDARSEKTENLEEQDQTNVIKLSTLSRKQKIEMTYTWLIEKGQNPIQAKINSRRDEFIQKWEEEFTRKQRLDQNPEDVKQAQALVQGRKEKFLSEVRVGLMSHKGEKLSGDDLIGIQEKAYKAASEFELEDPEATGAART